MNTNHKLICTAIAALAASTAIIATPTAVGAHSPQRWDVCPAADTDPLCEIVRTPDPSGADGSEVAHLPAADGTAVWTGDTKDHPGYGPVNQVDSEASSDCFPADRSPTAGDVSGCSHHRPGEDDNGTADRIDIPDYNCDEWRNPVIACPGLDGTAERINSSGPGCRVLSPEIVACPV